MSPNSGVIFDMDGLMVDTERIARIAWQEASRAAGYEMPDTVFSLMIGRTKRDFVGKRSLARPAMAGLRHQLVGLLAEDGKPLEEGAQLIDTATSRDPQGHVTSAYPATSLGHPIALALLAGGRARIGQTVHVFADGAVRAANIVSPVFYDTAGARLDV